MALRPTEAAERGFGRAKSAAERARGHALAGDSKLFEVAISSCLVEMCEALGNLAVAERQTYDAVK